MSFTRFLPAVLLVLAGCSVAPRPDAGPDSSAARSALGASADEEVAMYRNAITALNNAQLDAAQTELRRITRSRPEIAGPWVNLALIDIRKNDLESARKNVTTALERNPRMPQAFNVRGYVELSQGNVAQAADSFRQAIALRDDYAIAHYNYALIHDIYYQDAAVAVRHYKRYLTLTNNQDKKTAEWVAELERQSTKEAK